jgi:very-short-patch-repair endonuclease
VGGFLFHRGKRQTKADTRVPRARQLRRVMTDAERKLWWCLRELEIGNSHFRRQATIGPFYADFACHECKLVIELDGSGHMQADRVAADDARTRYLEAQGYRVLRFWNSDVLKEIDGVMSVIHDAAIATPSLPPPTPDPSPPRARARGGRGKRPSGAM